MSEQLAGEANRRWLANLTVRHQGITKAEIIEPGVFVYSGKDDRIYMKAAHLAMRSRDPNYPEILRTARAKAKAETAKMLRAMVEKGMIPAHMGPPDEPEPEATQGEEAA